MQHFFCPRCKFHMATAKRLCPTCGFRIQPKGKAEGLKKEQEVKAPSGFWSKVFKLDFTSHSNPKTDQEKSAVIS